MDVHIGNLIASKMKELHINNAELALRIQMGRMNVHSIVRRKTLKVDLLEKISRALNYDFFRYYGITDHSLRETHSQTKQAELMTRIEALEKKLQAAEAEILTLNRVIDALKQ